MTTMSVHAQATVPSSLNGVFRRSPGVTFQEDINQESVIIFRRSLEWDGVRVEHGRTCSLSAECRYPEHRVSIPLTGSWGAESHSAAGRQTTVRKILGHAMIMPAGHTFTVRNNGMSECFSILLEPEYVTNAIADASKFWRAELVESLFVRDPLIRQIGLALMAEVASGEAADLLYADSLTNALAIHLIKKYSSGALKPKFLSGGLARHKLRLVEEFIAANFGRDLSLSEVANAAGLSPYHFARAFKRSTGMTPHHYLTGVRIERARALLASSDLPIIEICFRVGFKSQSYFTTLFRNQFCTTPAAYRHAARR
jgi:AraC family transcriptional regulator